MSEKNVQTILFELQRNLEELSSAKEQVDFFRDKSSEVTEGISQLRLNYDKHLQQIKENYEEKTAKIDTQITNFLVENEKIYQETIQNGVNSINGVSEEIGASIREQITVINELFESYKNLVEASNTLVETLNAIDFNTKLDALTSKSQLIIETINGVKQALELKLGDVQNQVHQNTKSEIGNLSENINQNNIHLITQTIESNKQQTNEMGDLYKESQKMIGAKIDEKIQKLNILMYVLLVVIVLGFGVSYLL